MKIGEDEIHQAEPGIWELYQDISQTKKEIEIKASLVGCTAEFADDKTIQLDFDSKEVPEDFHSNLGWYMGQLKMNWRYEERKSRNGNVHVILHLDEPLPPMERILIQALMGSDLRRELLNYTRLKTGNEGALVCLFKPKFKQLTDGSPLVLYTLDGERKY